MARMGLMAAEKRRLSGSGIGRVGALLSRSRPPSVLVSSLVVLLFWFVWLLISLVVPVIWGGDTTVKAEVALLVPGTEPPALPFHL